MLPQINVASPCTADWERMTGDNRVRHCAQCNLNVYNFSEMSSGEIAQLLAASRGQRLCGRLYRRPDGTLLTSDCPVGLRSRIRRVSRTVGAALAAAMSVSLAGAQTAQRQPSSIVQIERAETGIHLVVFDESRAVITKARVFVTNLAGDQIAEGATNATGQIRFPALAPDTYHLTVKVLGFKTLKTTVSVPAHQMVDLEVTLQVGPAQGFWMGEVVAVDVQTQPSVLDLSFIPERLMSNAEPSEPVTVPERPPAARSPFWKFFHALGRVLNP
jgi:hypothetical protein